ncbi:MAG: hypothetical protein QHH14_09735 [Clostridiales bacterium]|nr:hypothetical protein [Clostridiales bacterium]
MRKTILAAVAALIFGTLARADSLNLSLFQSSTDNLFQTAFAEKDQISSLSFSFEKSFQPFSFFSEGSYSYLYENTNVSYYAQDVGLDYVHSLNEKTALYLALKAVGTLYRADFADFNFFSVGAAAATKTYFTQTSIMKLSYTFDYRNYNNYIFDFTGHLATFSIDKFFETRTTLKTELTWGYKYFLHPFAAAGSLPEDGVFRQHGGHGMGPAYYSGSRTVAKQASTGENQGQGLQIFSLTGLIAQGIGDRIGLRISGTRQWTLSGKNPFASIEEFYLVENPTYDVFAWNGTAVSAQLTIEAPWNTQLKIGYTKSSKEFPGIEAMNMEGVSLAVTRQDTRNQWEARLEKNFPSFSFYFSYSYVDNASNDPLFDWKGNFLSAGIGWNLAWGTLR